jgi:hypothetical protein
MPKNNTKMSGDRVPPGQHAFLGSQRGIDTISKLLRPMNDVHDTNNTTTSDVNLESGYVCIVSILI